ncbi:aspartate aminotransferase family protein [Herbaspirillum rubrisubalbicans]|uniref:Aspartate aminotransferase family protein n=1 Tax=Herbaspirillum rubrisubalbicans TaxID=80842 RepID=A0AAD0XF34_9BURK|nr:aspartate aminotransferase family protein [Herbaspirillum rubrisubalbicans]ALU87962.1 4-aminobutyrate aminotransferase protein [Herbaspirillum rubrisubalbicans M1]AYR23047.1 aspartate aminotransferase family protein [Herbaspirillum rubrisubalbicans]
MTHADGMLALNAFNPQSGSTNSPATCALIERRRNTFGDGVPLFYRDPVHFVSASGVWLRDQEGLDYLDAYNNVPSVGHCHPHVVAAVSKQVATLNTHTRYLSNVVTSYAERLLGTFPRALSKVLFTSSGTESVDLAMRLARLYTGGTGFIVTRFAYHGHSTAVAEITPAFGPGVPVGVNVRLVDAPDGYRQDAPVGVKFAQDVATAIADLERHGIKFAGLILDTVCSSDGLFVDPPGFLKEVVATVKKAGGVFVADEVQPGFGRTGEGMWGFERHGIDPDIVVMGKPMGNGMPIAATVTTSDIMQAFTERSGYFNTFGGNTVCCAAASAVLDVIESEGLIDNAKQTGAYLKRGLEQLKVQHQCIGDVRAIGLYAAVEFVQPGTKNGDAVMALNVVNELRKRRVLISTCGPQGNILKIRPPLQFSSENCDILVTAIDDTLRIR